MQITLQDKNMKRICLVIILAIWAMSVFSAPEKYRVVGDSIGTTQVEGDNYIIYKVSGGETVYSVSRRYGIPYATIVSANPGVDMNAVKAGQKILVPSHYSASGNIQRSTSSDNARTREIKYHTVSGGETMYSIARKYNTGVSELMAVNPEIKNYAIKAGQKIKIPAESMLTSVQQTTTASSETAYEPVAESEKQEVVKKDKELNRTPVIPVVEKKEEPVAETKSVPKETAEQKAVPEETYAVNEKEISSSTLPVTDKNKPFSSTFAEYTYNTTIVSASEKGVATWIDGSNDLSTQNERYYALHNKAPIGSVIKIRNLMNNRVIYAKVIGTLSEDEVNQKVMVKLSAGAAQKLNVLDNRFVVEATYFESKDTSTSSK